MNLNYYEILNISEKATQEEVKKAYRQLCKSYHPDTNPAENAAVFFRLLQEAYDTLSNEQSRAEYDRKLAGKDNPLQENEQPASWPEERPWPNGVEVKYHDAAAPVLYKFAWPLRIIFTPVVLVLMLLEAILFFAHKLISLVAYLIILLMTIYGIVSIFNQVPVDEIILSFLFALAGVAYVALGDKIIEGVGEFKIYMKARTW